MKENDTENGRTEDGLREHDAATQDGSAGIGGDTVTAPESRRRKTLLTIILAVSAAVFVAAAVLLAVYYLGDTDNPDDSGIVSSQTTTVTSSEEVSSVELVENPIDFAKLQEINPGLCAWITIPDTKIDYVIARSTDDQKEDYYLNHNYKMKKTFAGTIYMQKCNRSDFTSPNTVLYGHNMLNGTMFAGLGNFRKKSFFKSHDTMYIYTPGHIYTYHIFAALVYDDRNIMHTFNFNSDSEYADFLDQITNPKSSVKNVDKETTVTTDDRIVTLSTCTGSKSQRYIVVGVLIDDQPTY